MNQQLKGKGSSIDTDTEKFLKLVESEINVLRAEMQKLSRFKINIRKEIQELIKLRIEQLPKDINLKNQNTFRYSSDYLPAKKKTQDLESPQASKLSFENPVVGFGFFGSDNCTELYIILKDGSKSCHGSKTHASQF